MGRYFRKAFSLLISCLLLVTAATAQYAATGTVNATALRLRQEPATNAAILATLQRNATVVVTSEEQVINDEGAWYAVSYGALNGYMSAEFLVVTDSGAGSTTTAPAVTTGLTTARVNFRTDASTDASVLKVLPKGTALEITATLDGWYAVSHKGVSGYVSADYVSPGTAAAATVYAYTGSSTTSRDREIASEVMALSSLSDTQAQLLNVAVSLLGAPYVYGSSGSSSFDCSGFTSYVFKQLGISLQRTALNQYRLNGTAVNSSGALQAGDLVFFRDTAISKNAVSHVGIYLGQGLFIHAGSGNTGAGRCVKVSDLTTGYYARVFHSGKRVLS